MSSILVMRQKKSIHMITDAASYTDEGIVGNFGLKVVAMPHLNAAINTRGPSFATRLVATDIENEFDTFDQIVTGLETFTREFFERNEESFREYAFPEIEIYVCGWSAARSRPEGYMIRSYFEDSEFHRDQSLLGTYRLPPNTLQTLSECCAAPSITPAEMITAKFPSHLHIDKMDPRVDGLHLFQIQRGKLSERKDQPPHCSVGGFTVLTTIRENDITQSIIARFDDKVGELIKPESITDWGAWRDAIRNGRHLKPRADPQWHRGRADENIIAATSYHQLTTSLADVAMGTKTAGQAFQSFSLMAIRAIEEMIIKLTIVGPLMRGLTGGGGGILALLTGTYTTAADAGIGSGVGSGGYNFIDAQVAHSGGMVGYGVTTKVDPAYFENAPRFDVGGKISGDAPSQ